MLPEVGGIYETSERAKSKHPQTIVTQGWDKYYDHGWRNTMETATTANKSEFVEEYAES